MLLRHHWLLSFFKSCKLNMMLTFCSVVSLINLWIQLNWLLTVCSYSCTPSGGGIYQFHLYWITAWLTLLLFLFFFKLSCAKNKLYWNQKNIYMIFDFFTIHIHYKKENVKERKNIEFVIIFLVMVYFGKIYHLQ